MVAVFLPPLWVAIVPIIVLEAAVVSRLTGHPFRRALVPLAVANAVSTIIGVPILWSILALVEMLCCGGALGLTNIWAKIYAVTVQAPWLIPYESEFGWMIPAALVTLGVWFAAFSVLVETPIASRALRVPARSMWRGMISANIISYLLLGIFGWILMLMSAKLDALHTLFGPVIEALVGAIFAVASWMSK